MVVASFKGRGSWQTRLSLFLLAAISGNGSEKASPVSMNDSSWLLERYRCWLVIDGEMLCILL